MKKRTFLLTSILGYLVVCVIAAALSLMVQTERLSPVFSILILLAFFLFLQLILLRNYSETRNWYNQLMDHMSQPASVTDLNMKWTFINKPVEDMLQSKREKVLGQHCSNWGAKICNTEDCGVNCLLKNQPQTNFDQFGMNFKVDTDYLYSIRGKKSDISRLSRRLQRKFSLPVSRND